MGVNLYRVTVGPNEWKYTSGEFDVVAASETWTAVPLKRADLSLDLKATEMSLTIPIDLAPFNTWKYNVPSIPINLEVFDYPSMGVKFKGRVTGISYNAEKGMAGVKIGSTDTIANTSTPHRTYGTSCSFELYSAECGVNIDTHKVIINVAEISWSSPTTMSHGALGGVAGGAFRNGFLILDTGESQFITNHNGSTLNILSALGTLGSANIMAIYFGCNKSKETCASKFKNLPNFGGFPMIPTQNPVTEGF